MSTSDIATRENLSNTPSISVVVPVYNDLAQLARLLPCLAQLPIEVVISDGGSTDGSQYFCRTHGLQPIVGSRGRGAQLQRGVAHAQGDWLWLLHADTSGDLVSALRALQQRAADNTQWGWFDVRLDSARASLRLISWFMNQRARITRIATGDQGIFVSRELLLACGGIPVQPLMEDIELSRRLKSRASPQPLPGPLLSSARRWHQQGTLRTVLSMWVLRLRYFFGADPQTLARKYYGY